MSSTLTIRRLHTTCTVDSRFAAAVRDRTERACRDHIPAALRSASGWLERDPDSVWIVRRLDLSILSGVDAPPDDIATSIVKSLGRALATTLTADGDGINAIRFANRAAYLARFIADIAAGAAWTRWYFAPLSGWRLLPASSAIRSALVENPAIGLTALRSLGDRELDAVVSCLTNADEQLVLESLELGASAVTTDPAVDPPPVPRRRARQSAASRTRVLIAYIKNGRSVSAGRAGDRVVRRAAERAAIDSQGSEEPVVTRFGGVALLLRDVNALPWAAWTAAWPQPADGFSAEACLKWLTLATCMGPGRGAMLGDPVWRDLLGVPPRLSLHDVGRWLRASGRDRRSELMHRLTEEAGAGARHWSAVLRQLAELVYRRFASRLPGFADSSPDYLRRNFLDFSATVEREAERVIVHCGRPPLHLVLTLTGMTRGSAVAIDSGGRPILVLSGLE